MQDEIGALEQALSDLKSRVMETIRIGVLAEPDPDIPGTFKVEFKDEPKVHGKPFKKGGFIKLESAETASSGDKVLVLALPNGPELGFIIGKLLV